MSALSPEEVAQLRANDNDTLRVPLIVGHIVCLFVAFISVILRFWARRLVKIFWGADDWTNAGGLFITGVYTASNLVMIEHGMGRHIWWLDDVPTFVKLSLVAEVTYTMAIPLIKCSILLLYHRIFPQKWLNLALLGLGFFITAYNLAQILATIFQCAPVDSLWGASPKEHCINVPLLIKICGTINILTDVAILALPIPSLWKLNLSVARKRLLIVMFSMGGIACVASIVRLFYVDKIGNSHDPTWDYAIPALIANAELCIGVLAANLPTYRPLVSTLVSSRRANDSKRTSQGGARSYLPIKDSLQVPISSHFTRQSVTNLELDDVEMFRGNVDQKVKTDISNGGEVWNGHHDNTIQVTTSLRTYGS
ncbi:hypothetical protein K504DRAFT_442554 [Pleomassaria siparia CBS 279.74]|uniref:Rhodopsin domain-containing protein n=1 Tax=Pleomassaria siparia CBS 279.74 TaxID=1314801 RepID=A0A6G1JUS9_9PLEO|nr:hypothetical protein K504DRAFT_442554 [Pleomassaria siparia CBS 279.74]